jgi:threonine/homoserine/homoserine lactone efflux protein
VQGVGLQFLNIKAWMLALAIVAGWVAGREDATARTLVLLPIMVAYGFFSNLTYALAGSMLRHWLTHGRRLPVARRVMGKVSAKMNTPRRPNQRPRFSRC